MWAPAPGALLPGCDGVRGRRPVGPRTTIGGPTIVVPPLGGVDGTTIAGPRAVLTSRGVPVVAPSFVSSAAKLLLVASYSFTNGRRTMPSSVRMLIT